MCATTDSDGLSFDKEFVIHVENISEQAVIDAPSSITINEGVVSTLQVTYGDPDGATELLEVEGLESIGGVTDIRSNEAWIYLEPDHSVGRDHPYELTLSVRDGATIVSHTVQVTVRDRRLVTELIGTPTAWGEVQMVSPERYGKVIAITDQNHVLRFVGDDVRLEKEAVRFGTLDSSGTMVVLDDAGSVQYWDGFQWQSPEQGSSINRLVQDAEGRVFAISDLHDGRVSIQQWIAEDSASTQNRFEMVMTEARAVTLDRQGYLVYWTSDNRVIGYASGAHASDVEQFVQGNDGDIYLKTFSNGTSSRVDRWTRSGPEFVANGVQNLVRTAIGLYTVNDDEGVYKLADGAIHNELGSIGSIGVDEDGQLYALRTDGGLLHHHGGVNNYTPITIGVRNMRQTAIGLYTVNDDEGVYKLRGGVPHNELGSIGSIGVDEDGQLYALRTDGGLLHHHGGVNNYTPITSGVRNMRQTAIGLYTVNDDEGVYKLRGGVPHNELGSIGSIGVDEDGQLYALRTDGGLLHHHGGVNNYTPITSGVRNMRQTAIGLYTVNDDEGVYKLRGGVPHNELGSIGSIGVDEDGQLYALRTDGGLLHHHGGVNNYTPITSGVRNMRQTVIGLYTVNDDEGVYRVSRGAVHNELGSIRSITVDSNGLLYALRVDGGLLHHRGGVNHYTHIASGVRNMLQTAIGAYTVHDDEGVYKLSGATVHNELGHIRSISVDRDGELYALRVDGGLLHHHGGVNRFTTIASGVTNMLQTAIGVYTVHDNEGVYRLSGGAAHNELGSIRSIGMDDDGELYALRFDGGLLHHHGGVNQYTGVASGVRNMVQTTIGLYTVNTDEGVYKLSGGAAHNELGYIRSIGVDPGGKLYALRVDGALLHHHGGVNQYTHVASGVQNMVQTAIGLYTLHQDQGVYRLSGGTAHNELGYIRAIGVAGQGELYAVTTSGGLLRHHGGVNAYTHTASGVRGLLLSQDGELFAQLTDMKTVRVVDPNSGRLSSADRTLFVQIEGQRYYWNSEVGDWSVAGFNLVFNPSDLIKEFTGATASVHDIADWASDRWDAGSDWVGDRWGAASDWLSDRWEAGSDWLSDRWEAGADWLSDRWEAGSDWLSDRWEAGSDWVSVRWETGSDFVHEHTGWIWPEIASWPANVSNWIDQEFGEQSQRRLSRLIKVDVQPNANDPSKYDILVLHNGNTKHVEIQLKQGSSIVHREGQATRLQTGWVNFDGLSPRNGEITLTIVHKHERGRGEFDSFTGPILIPSQIVNRETIWNQSPDQDDSKGGNGLPWTPPAAPFESTDTSGGVILGAAITDIDSGSDEFEIQFAVDPGWLDEQFAIEVVDYSGGTGSVDSDGSHSYSGGVRDGVVDRKSGIRGSDLLNGIRMPMPTGDIEGRAYQILISTNSSGAALTASYKSIWVAFDNVLNIGSLIFKPSHSEKISEGFRRSREIFDRTNSVMRFVEPAASVVAQSFLNSSNTIVRSALPENQEVFKLVGLAQEMLDRFYFEDYDGNEAHSLDFYNELLDPAVGEYEQHRLIIEWLEARKSELRAVEGFLEAAPGLIFGVTAQEVVGLDPRALAVQLNTGIGANAFVYQDVKVMANKALNRIPNAIEALDNMIDFVNRLP